MRLAAESFIAAVAIVVCLSVPAAAGPFEEAAAANERGDYSTVLRLLRPPAEQGNVAAQYNLGVMHADGEGVPQDNVEAVKWYRLAAERGHAGAQRNLGGMYGEGQGVPQDYVMAHMWFNLAAAQGYEDAIKNRDVAASRMTPADISEAQRLAREWKPK